MRPKSISSQRRKAWILYMETMKLRTSPTNIGRLLNGTSKSLKRFRIKKASPSEMEPL
jgi:hypothetical protein